MEKISVIIPVYNGEKYIGKALNSVISQTLQPTEIIVVNDGSTDQTATIVKSFEQVKLINMRKCGVPDALNTGVNQAKGTHIAFLDADDLWSKEKLEKQIQILRKNPKAGLVFSKIQQFESEDIATELKGKYLCREEIFNGYHRSTLLASKTALKQIGPFQVGLNTSEFIEWYSRAKDLGVTSIVHEEVLAKRRIHGNNMMLGEEAKKYQQLPSVIKQILERRREQNGEK
ncbi:glycosyltransferase family A protein [Algivirga pacifica]|uniref:Glycosyltransferase n=1 Tax=Algivirga pacifica TaxID=1162670 RepID=A0ABP9D997_9BACT